MLSDVDWTIFLKDALKIVVIILILYGLAYMISVVIANWTAVETTSAYKTFVATCKHIRETEVWGSPRFWRLMREAAVAYTAAESAVPPPFIYGGPLPYQAILTYLGPFIRSNAFWYFIQTIVVLFLFWLFVDEDTENPEQLSK